MKLPGANGHAIEVLSAEIRALKDLMEERKRTVAIEVLAQKVTGLEQSLGRELEAADKAVKAALAAAKEASAEQKDALKEYKAASNEWRDTVTQLTGRLSEMGELKQRMLAQDDKINDLKISRGAAGGKEEARADLGMFVRWALPFGLAFLGFLLANGMFGK